MGRPGEIRILVVDDQAATRLAITTVLSEEPDLVIIGEAKNGTEAIRLVQELRPDVVIMDMYMPWMDGVEATERIRAACPEVKIIGLSADEGAQAMIAMLEAGVVAFVDKSDQLTKLIAAVRSAHSARPRS